MDRSLDPRARGLELASTAGIWDEVALARRFDEVGGFTVGVEEETMLLDPETLDLAPVSGALLARLGGDARFKPELPAAQLEIVTASTSSAHHAVTQLAQGRRALARAAAGLAVPAAAGAHPFARELGVLNHSTRYDEIRQDYGLVANRQLVASLQVHVAVGGATRSLAVYNALRGYLPELAALAANAPFHQGADSGLASVRPGICVQLPRQGVPPSFASFREFAEELAWGISSRSLRTISRWWWELRPHPVHGTLELRVPDAQTTLIESAGLIAFIQALVAMLAEAYDRAEPLLDAPTWRIQENRWSALRDGVEGTMVDLESGKRHATRERLLALAEQVQPTAKRLGTADLLVHTRASIERNGALRQREAATARGVRGLAGWLGDRFLDGLSRDKPTS